MKRTTILMLIPNFGFGGAQRVFRDLSISLSQRFNILECVFNLEDQHIYKSPNQVISLDINAGKNILQKAVNLFLRVKKLKAIKRKYDVAITISHLEGADYVNLLSSTKNEKVIICIHGSKIHDTAIAGILGWARMRIFMPFLYPKADKIVTVANGISEEIHKYFQIHNDKILVINNGFDLEGIKQKSLESIDEKYKVIFEKPVLITHGRIVFEKNQILLLKLAAHPSLRDKCNILVIGDGPMLNELVVYSRSTGLSTYYEAEKNIPDARHSVFFIGYQANPFPFLKFSSLFLFPSIFEGFPMALVEAMICNLPVIAANCPYGPAEILNPDGTKLSDLLWAEYGILITCKKDDYELDLWVNCVEELLANVSIKKNYKLKSEIRTKAFTMDSFESKWTKLINDLI